MSPKGSALTGPMVVELVGPLVDDRGALLRTVDEALRRAGIEPRPGALAQVAGGSVAWALGTLLDGHGRADEPDRAATIAREVQAGWERAARSGFVARPDAVSWWGRRLDSSATTLVCTSLPEAIALAVGEAAGLEGLAAALVPADGGDGLPRPDRIRSALADRRVVASDVTAAVTSPAALLAATGAGCGRVVLVGAAGPVAEMLAEHRSATLDAIE